VVGRGNGIAGVREVMVLVEAVFLHASCLLCWILCLVKVGELVVGLCLILNCVVEGLMSLVVVEEEVGVLFGHLLLQLTSVARHTS